jgi:L-iditol 2-dehydrogenase
MSFTQAALLEPLSVAVHALGTAHLPLGRPALICGAGPIGLITLACARASGAWPLAITDVDHRRLEFAKAFIPGVKTFLIPRDQSAEVNARMIRRLFKLDWKEGEVIQGESTQGRAETCSEYDAPWTVLECTGVESSVVTACFAVRRGGTVIVIGVGKAVMNNIPFMHISLAEVRQTLPQAS